MLYSMTYGIMPTRDQFEDGWHAKREAGALAGNHFYFGQDSRVGTCMLNEFEVWEYLEKALDENTPESLEWIASVLRYLDIDWVIE